MDASLSIIGVCKSSISQTRMIWVTLVLLMFVSQIDLTKTARVHSQGLHNSLSIAQEATRIIRSSELQQNDVKSEETKLKSDSGENVVGGAVDSSKTNSVDPQKVPTAQNEEGTEKDPGPVSKDKNQNISKNNETVDNTACVPGSNSTSCKPKSQLTSFKNTLYENSGMLYRAMLVLLGITGIVVVYFVIKAVMLRRRRSKSRKYGIVAQHGPGDMEMEPLGDGDDDDDDFTVFEVNGRRK